MERLSVYLLFILITGCAIPKPMNPNVNKQGEKLFKIIENAAMRFGGQINENGTSFKDIGAYVPAQISVESRESKPILVSSNSFSVSPDAAGSTRYGISDMEAGDYKAEKYVKYLAFYIGDAAGRIREVSVKLKTRYLVQELANGKPDGREEWSGWDDEWKTDSKKTIEFINDIRKQLGKPTCADIDNLYCK